MLGFPHRSILTTRTAPISSRSRGSRRCRIVATDALSTMFRRRNKGTVRMDFKGGTPNTMNFTSRMGIKVLVVVVVVVVAFGAGGIVAERHLAASPSPVNS